MKTRTASLISLIAINLALIGCATPYQPSGFRGGYKDVHIRDNVYYVEFGGNALITASTAAQYFHRRAKEVCVEHGYRDYRVSQPKDITGYAGIVNETSASLLQKPGFAGYVECLS
jgi:hypothetical protein